jgi:hypothetical protein
MVIPELEQQLLQLSSNDKLYIIQLLAQSLTTNNNNTQPNQQNKLIDSLHQTPLAELTKELDLSQVLRTLIESLQPENPTFIREYPQPQFYGCIEDETFFRHPQGQQPSRQPIE